jgi:hypothetical protein
MEIMGTSVILSLGAWRVRFVLAIEETNTPQAAQVRPPHRMRIVPNDEYASNGLR